MFIATTCISQSAKIFRGTTEFRNIIFDHYLIKIQQLERIRIKLDSVGVTDSEFDKMYNNLNYIAKNLYNGELSGRQYIINELNSSSAYKSLNKKELAIIIDNIELILLNRLGIWDKRHPHKLNVNSLRLKEISQYGVEEGERILHYHAYQNHLSEILYLSYDNLQIAYNPVVFVDKKSKVFDLVSSQIQKESSTLTYSLEEYPKLINNQFYDKVVFDCLGILFYDSYPNLNKRIRYINQLLAADGELIVSANYKTIKVDGGFPEISKLDKKIEKILDLGFKLKERIFSENEYIIYKFMKEVK